MQVKIYKPTKTSMQSGSLEQKWLIEFVQNDSSKFIEPYLRRTSSSDMMNEVVLSFNRLNDAIDFAKHNNYQYEVIKTQKMRLIKKSYADNFK